MSNPTNQGKCARCDNTDSSHNIQGIRSRQEYPVNSQRRRFMSNRSRQPQVQDSQDTSTLRILVSNTWSFRLCEVRKQQGARRVSGDVWQGRIQRQEHFITGSQANIKFQRSKDPRKPLINVTKSDACQEDRCGTANQHMSRSRSHAAKSGRILACGLEGVQMPSYTGQSSPVIGQRKEVNSPIQSSEGSTMVPINCPVVRQSTKDSDKLITRPQAARDQRRCAQSNQGITQRVFNKHIVSQALLTTITPEGAKGCITVTGR
ncbi:hypothetical protein B9Z55_017611 [Caenorhabditis nigoni]|uniref:Uncharacterized protein n=1 Tax=Caenorhabditis nigoni TaxID=1611254 RepID=A0A2G5T9X3_9PELO|nr:hypothetical protein B9Z55_017611 [Caenorhabditis nigoni]